MSFGLLSATGVFLGVVALAAGLWLAQRLRVQHREVEVLSTLFWQAAIEETRARVFVRRFRHWRAWVLLVAIASLLWLLVNQPRAASDGTRHVVLVDWSVDDAEVRERDLETALEFTADLPEADREVIAVGSHLETLLQPHEPLELARQRNESRPRMVAHGMDWAIESLAARANEQTPIAIHIVGNAPVDEARLAALRTGTPQGFNVFRAGSGIRQNSQTATNGILANSTTAGSAELATLGVSESANSDWSQVDVWIVFAKRNDAAKLSVQLDKQPLDQPVIERQDGTFEIEGLAANGAVIEVAYEGRSVGALTLPRREPIRVFLDGNVPAALRQLVELDSACEIVAETTDATVIMGSAQNANFRLTSDNEPAFFIQADNDDPDAALAGVVDELALRQIDATAIAQQSGQVVDVQVASGDTRALAIWQSLFTPSFDFVESRACPIVVGQSIRWLASRPPLVEWAELGRRLPDASPEFERANTDITSTNDGREVRTTRLTPLPSQSATLGDSSEGLTFAGFNFVTWLGLLVAVLLIGEWVLFQKGYLP